jgi:hypothetical protein
MLTLLAFIVGLIMGGLAVGLLALARRVSELERGPRLPYKVRSGLDDLSAIDTDTLLIIRDALLVAEARLGDKHKLMAEIRQGKYDPEQPAAPRRGNGKPKGTA